MSLDAKRANAAFARVPNASSLVDLASHRRRMPESRSLRVATSALRARKELAWTLPKEPTSSPMEEVTLLSTAVGFPRMALSAVTPPHALLPLLRPPQRVSVVLRVQVLASAPSRPPRAQAQRRYAPTLLRQIAGSAEVRSPASSERR